MSRLLHQPAPKRTVCEPQQLPMSCHDGISLISCTRTFKAPKEVADRWVVWTWLNTCLFSYLLAIRKWETWWQPLDSERFPNVRRQKHHIGSCEYINPRSAGQWSCCLNIPNQGYPTRCLSPPICFICCPLVMYRSELENQPFIRQAHHYKK